MSIPNIDILNLQEFFSISMKRRVNKPAHFLGIFSHYTSNKTHIYSVIYAYYLILFLLKYRVLQNSLHHINLHRSTINEYGRKCKAPVNAFRWPGV